MKTVTKRQLADLVARRTGAKRHVVKEILQAVLDGIIEELGKGSRLEFREFGVFEVKHRQSRFAQNPRTLERVSLPAKRIVKFK
ncbi:MAG: HU family DNA-binding protein, partial [Planctomycetia bacterium]|nr:HU family DNA-binding protein [Planctomycetia bacterium]